MTDLRVSGATKRFGATQVLGGVDLDVAAGELMAVLGPSGCGKTTLLRLIAGFDHPDSGTIALGTDVVSGPGGHVPAQVRRVGYVAQEGALFPHLDVARNVTFGLGRRLRRQHARVAELLRLVGLDASYANRYPHELSGGQQQRIAVARALAPDPSLVLLDEPFASLDSNLRRGTGRAVADALREAGATAVLVTHDQSEALSLADRVAVMADGRIVQVDRPQQVYQRPTDPAVASFVGGSVLLAAVLRDGLASCALGEVHVTTADSIDGQPTAGPVQVLVRPEQIELSHEREPEGVLAQVIDISYFGHDADARLRLGDGQLVVARINGTNVPEPGSQVWLTVRSAVLAFPATGSEPLVPAAMADHADIAERSS